MKIGIIGAGVTGLSIGQLLNKEHNVELLESNIAPGGIARTKDVSGIAYHTVGGHCFNSKHKEVLDFVFNEILPIEYWNIVNRNSKIKLDFYEINYPIEYSVKDIYRYNPDLAFKITNDFFNSLDDGSYSNLDEWFRKKFGNELTDLYFSPYNKKIWGLSPKKMNSEWVVDKLPIPNKREFFDGLISNKNDKMPHSWFYYPKSNNQNTFIEALATGLKIIYSTAVAKIEKCKDGKWKVNDQFEYDLLINTSPLNVFPTFIVGVPENIIEASNKLKYNRVSNGLWRTKDTDKTWTYLPGDQTIFHRYIHIGSFHTPKNNFTITEAIGNHSSDEIKKFGLQNDFLIEMEDYSISKHAYVVFDENYKTCRKMILDYLNNIGVYSIGRFGGWQYSNMDICIKESMDLAKLILKM